MGSRKKRNKSSKKRTTRNVEIVDERFRADGPQFQKPREQASKVVLDERFSSVLTDPRFRLQEKDKYGRKKKGTAENELNAFYTVDKEEKEEEQSCRSETGESPVDKEQTEHFQSDAEESDDDDDEEVKDPASRIAYLTALSRGELDVSSSSDEEEESETSESDSDGIDEEEDPVYGKAGVLDPSAKEDETMQLTDTRTPFMAVTNVDWENVRAVDLFAILSSFTPPGSVKRVRVFPSNFGIEQMAQDALYGPSDLWKKKKKKNEDLEEASDQESDEYEENDANSSDGFSDEEQKEITLQIENDHVESDFDPEKLRAYEAGKLKYFFAVVEFASSEHADAAYREVDGLEIERSSAAIDMRAIPEDELDSVLRDRELRDEATAVPSNYEPPDFIVSALQQTSVRCTWEDGDLERESKLTGYGRGEPGSWGALAESDDLRAYLASDVSSDENDSDCSDKKGKNMRKLLGLDSDDEREDQNQSSDDSDEDDDENQMHLSDVSASDEEDDGFSKQVTFVPGKGSLEDKIRSKLDAKKEGTQELTPWQKYQLKRKEKRRERRAARRKTQSLKTEDVMHGPADFDGDDDFFKEEKEEISLQKTLSGTKKRPHINDDMEGSSAPIPSTKEELELLLAGDNDEEEAKDFDMRGLQRIDKIRGKKLRGSRKRKAAELATNISGTEFKLNTKDDRFAAVLDGTDDRFGIDPTDPSFKETPAMRLILAEQTKRRKAKKHAKTPAEKIAPNVSADADADSGNTGGAMALSSLVMSLKSKVAKRTQ